MEGDFIPRHQLDKAADLLESALEQITLSDTEFARYEVHRAIAPKLDRIRGTIQQAIALIHTHEEEG